MAGYEPAGELKNIRRNVPSRRFMMTYSLCLFSWNFAQRVLRARTYAHTRARARMPARVSVSIIYSASLSVRCTAESSPRKIRVASFNGTFRARVALSCARVTGTHARGIFRNTRNRTKAAPVRPRERMHLREDTSHASSGRVTWVTCVLLHLFTWQYTGGLNGPCTSTTRHFSPGFQWKLKRTRARARANCPALSSLDYYTRRREWQLTFVSVRFHSSCVIWFLTSSSIYEFSSADVFFIQAALLSRHVSFDMKREPFHE